ncbi:MAG: hypothetical protein GX275_10295, partial [Clostridiales bacterium]|nr:hypothetical protein [Clostridiales bacterium]
MGKLSKKLVSIITAVLVTFGITFTSLPAMEAKAVTSINSVETTYEDGIKSYIKNDNVEANSATDYGLTQNIKDGAILHAWCWSLNTIRENLKSIAEAGYSAVQTIPINNIASKYTNMKIMGNDESGGTDGAWWWQYQPTDWQIGNYMVGTKEDFKALCEEAKGYGIKIIVDVVPNHTTSDRSQVSQNLINAAGGWNNLFHAYNRGIGNNQFNDRYYCTVGNACSMGSTAEGAGLPDAETENPKYQDYFIKYLNECISLGASGFRYDTAKHIGLPSDPMDDRTKQNGWSNNFWQRVTSEITNASSIFNYGEVLNDANVKETEYGQYMYVTASNYGGKIRGAVTGKNLNSGNIMGYNYGLPGSRSVTWVESHDTYSDNSSLGLSDWQIKMGWAIITARKDGTPLFFDRPDGANSGNKWGKNVLGAKGSDLYKDPEVAAVNKFRNAMVGESENLVNPDNRNDCLMIERGKKGVTIVNMGSQFDIKSKTSLQDGTYQDVVSGGTYTVSGGYFTSGSVPSGKVVVLYDHVNGAKVSSSVPSGKFKGESLSVTLSVSGANSGTYSVDGGSEKSFTNGTTITVGQNLQNGESTK